MKTHAATVLISILQSHKWGFWTLKVLWVGMKALSGYGYTRREWVLKWWFRVGRREWGGLGVWWQRRPDKASMILTLRFELKILIIIWSMNWKRKRVLAFVLLQLFYEERVKKDGSWKLVSKVVQCEVAVVQSEIQNGTIFNTRYSRRRKDTSQWFSNCNA